MKICLFNDNRLGLIEGSPEYAFLTLLVITGHDGFLAAYLVEIRG